MKTIILCDNTEDDELRKLSPTLQYEELFFTSSLKAVILDKKIQILNEEDIFYLKLKEKNLYAQISEITYEQLEIIKKEISISNGIWEELKDGYMDIYEGYPVYNLVNNALTKHSFISKNINSEINKRIEEFFKIFNEKSQQYIKSHNILYGILFENMKGLKFNVNSFENI